MATRSLIGIRQDDGKIKSVYCHSDGYLTHNGAMLIDHYKDRDKVEKLIKLGSLSMLGEKVDPDPNKEHSFEYDKRQEDVVVAYARDRGEELREAVAQTEEELFDKDSWIDYIYIFEKNGEWVYSDFGLTYNKELRSVKKDLDKEYERLGIKRPKDFYGFWVDYALEEEKKRQREANDK